MKPCLSPSRRDLPLLASRLLLVTPLLLPGPAAWAQVPDAWAPTANAAVYSVVPEPGGTVLAGGSFYWTGNPDGLTTGLMRLDAAGRVLLDFAPRIVNAGGVVQSAALRPDGSVLAVGGFSALFNEPELPIVSGFAHFAANGDLLPTYQITEYAPGFALAPLPDGRVVIGGNFGVINGQSRPMLARFLAGGALDPAFNPGANALVFTLAAQPDGQMLVGGMFTTLGGQPRNRIGRLSPTGAVDASFNPDANEAVICLLLQPDGKILVGGAFTSLGGQTRNRLARLLPDGSLDAAFNPNLNSTVQTLALQANGKILVGGSFTAVGGAGRSRLARLHPDGTLDLGFNVGATATVYSLALQDDGKVLVGGDFTQLGGLNRMRLGRLTNPDAPAQSMVFDGTTLTWQRGGALPEVWRTEAEAWSGTGFTNLGPGTRIAGGWQWTGLSLPPETTVRLLGHAKGGRFSASTWLSEAYSGPLALAGQPASRTNLAATSATFTAVFVGSEPIAYRWLKNGLPLADGANVSGAATPSLTLASVLGGDAGAYSLVASNTFGALTSAVAALTVIEPVITSQPTNAAPPVGGSATFSVTAVGTAPLFYEWWKNGSPIGGATASRLSFVPVQVADGGAYSVVVANGFGSVTSSVATLTVWGPPRITVPPTSQSNYFGAPVTLSVTAAGTAPLSYQWRKNGAVISGATGSALAFPSLAHPDVASYAVVVTNLYGSVTSAPVAVVILNPYFLTQPASLLRNAGESATFSAGAAGLAPLQYRWRKDGVLLAGASASSLTLTNVQATDAGNFDVVVTNLYGAVTSRVAVLAVNTLLPDGFNPMREVTATTINAVAPLPDGKVLVAGSFARVVGGVTTNLAMLHPDGSPDSTFTSSANLPVNCLVLEPGGKVLVGGSFTSLSGQTRNRLARLNPDGSLDTAFNPNVNGPVNCLALQPDGAILLGGSFDTVAGEGRTNLARLRPDGTLDASFKPRVSGSVNSLALQTNEAIVVGGSFTNLAGLARTNLGRLSSAGVADALFNPGANDEVRAVVVQPDGKIMVGGWFTNLAGADRASLGRLQPDGSLDAAFDPRVIWTVNTLALLADGSVLVGGSVSSVGGQPRAGLGRVDANGLVDGGFLAAANDFVSCLAPLPDGRLYVGGRFSRLSGQRRYGLGRLPSYGAVVEDAGFDGSELTWHRAGLAPEISQALAEAWNGTTWTILGPGFRAGDAWRWSLPSVPLATTFRVRGLVPSSGYAGAAWWTAAHGGLPLVSAPVAVSARNAGEAVTFSVRPFGSPPFGYRWLRDGLPLGDGGNVSGTTSADLTLATLSCSERGTYSVVVTNTYGSVTSLVASLTVRDPFIVSQPGSTTAGWGSNATFTVGVAGTPPFAYQWRRSGLAIPGATDTSLTITDVQPGDELGYDVAVSGGCGAATSIVAYLNQELAGCMPQEVMGLAPLPDGRLFAAGEIDTVGSLSRAGIVRYHSNGAPDASFNVHAGMVNYDVPLCYAVLVLPDRSVIVGGAFTNVAGMPPNRLLRLTPDGRIDPAFSPPSLNGQVLCLALQADGKILAGGDFTRAGSLTRNRLVRLNPDGSVDSGFTASVGGTVLTIAVQPDDGEILVGGDSGFGGSYAIRFLSTGALDTSFAPSVSGQVYAMAVQPGGMILLGGRFTAVGGISRSRIARLYPNGSLDLSFSPQIQRPANDPQVNSIVLQTDGRILVGGRFDTVNAQDYRMVVRLNANGSVDPSWNPGTHVVGLVVNSLAIQADGRVLTGGILEAVGDASRRNIVRLDNTDLATSSLVLGGGSATWLRGGTGPEVWRTTFHAWSGSGWTNLGAGTRISGGWQLGGILLPANATVRAQGFAISGDDNCSGYIVEEGFGPPVLSIPPVNRTNFAGTTAGLSAWVVGSGPVHYRWRKGGADLTDDGNVSGAGTPNLVLADVQSADAGWYSVVATNALGSVSSAEVYLAVVPLTLSATGPGLGLATNGSFRVELGGGAAWPVSVETSTNLVQWQAVGTPWVGPEPVVLTQPFTNTTPARMYRARPVP